MTLAPFIVYNCLHIVARKVVDSNATVHFKRFLYFLNMPQLLIITKYKNSISILLYRFITIIILHCYHLSIEFKNFVFFNALFFDFEGINIWSVYIPFSEEIFKVKALYSILSFHLPMISNSTCATTTQWSYVNWVPVLNSKCHLSFIWMIFLRNDMNTFYFIIRVHTERLLLFYRIIAAWKKNVTIFDDKYVFRDIKLSVKGNLFPRINKKYDQLDLIFWLFLFLGPSYLIFLSVFDQ